MVTAAAGGPGSTSMFALMSRTLYRSLLRTSSKFTDDAVLFALLHRTGIDDHINDWEHYIAQDAAGSQNKARVLPTQPKQENSTATHNWNSNSNHTASTTTTTTSSASSHRTYQRLFRRLLREVVAGGTTNADGQTMIFPSQVADTTRLRTIIQREFRKKAGGNNQNEDTAAAASSVAFDDATRRKVAFTALRELNKKLAFYAQLQAKNPPQNRIPEQAAWNVASLPLHPPSSYLQPGVFLVSHPYMQHSYFGRTVICVLEHKKLSSLVKKSRNRHSGMTNNNDRFEYGTMEDNSVDCSEEEEEEEHHAEANEQDNDQHHRIVKKRSGRRQATHQQPPGQTYGVIINRVSIEHGTGRNRTLTEVFREHMLPEKIAKVFGESSIREGGPVHVALQMIHSLACPADQEELAASVGGRIIPMITNGIESPALYSDRATYFQGNMFKMMPAVDDGIIDRGTLYLVCVCVPWQWVKNSYYPTYHRGTKLIFISPVIFLFLIFISSPNLQMIFRSTLVHRSGHLVSWLMKLHKGIGYRAKDRRKWYWREFVTTNRHYQERNGRLRIFGCR